MSDQQALLRKLPSVSAVLESPILLATIERHGRNVVASCVRQTIDDLRIDIQSSEVAIQLPTFVQIAEQVSRQIEHCDRVAIQPVINATGVLLHTGLGRAPLAEVAIQASSAAARGYCNVELDLETGQRARRSCNVSDLLSQLTGAEAAHVVNNNAGATALVLAALASGREVIVSHGELIEIGGGYRLPDVIETFGARLHPVGTTNRTRLSDYEAAIGEQTGAILVVHPSNYAISGFTQSPLLAEIADIARCSNVPLVHDIGSGALINFDQFGCHGEPVAADSIAAGADLVLFSGDKLLGGPQSGVIVGGQEWLDTIVKHPLNRALRVDKVTLAALRATLRLYRQPEHALKGIPLLQLLQTSNADLKVRGENIAKQLQLALPTWDIVVQADQAYLGGGSVPEQAIQSWCVGLSSHTDSLSEFAAQLRCGSTSVVPRVQNNQILLGLHAVPAQQDAALVEAVAKAANSL